ncbi:MAG: cytochrome C [Flavobacteriaceae bacterium]|nr:cytochrome C [Flavobacteriaceae bacterium]
MSYDTNILPDSPRGLEIKYGYRLFIETSQMLGVKSKENPYVGNALSCNNCHLNAGTQAFAIPLIGVNKRFPQYRGRENKTGSLEERINGCFERSMNGKNLKENSKEMKALLAYMNWLGRYVKEDEIINGKGLLKINYPDRAVNLINGKQVFDKHCVECHGEDGQGEKIDNYTFMYPPLWGSNSYNNGAGMTRVLTAAMFIKYNMPQGTTFDNPVLTDEESYDVAGYINQQLRPAKLNLEADFPIREKKPMSTPYPPYADSFSQTQHQLGPFKPIFEYYKKNYNIEKNK